MISRIYGTKLHEIARKMLTEKPSKRPTATELVKLFSDLPETLRGVFNYKTLQCGMFYN